MKLIIVLFILLLAIVYGLSRVSKSAAVRKMARLVVRIAGSKPVGQASTDED